MRGAYMSSALIGILTTAMITALLGFLFLFRRKFPSSIAWKKIYTGSALIAMGRMLDLWSIISGGSLPAIFSGVNRIVIEGAIGYIGGMILITAGILEMRKMTVPNKVEHNEIDIRERLLYGSVNSIIHPNRNLRTAIRSMLGYICYDYRLRGAFIHLFAPSGGTLKYFEGKSLDHSTKWYTKEFPLRDSIPGKAILEKRTIRISPSTGTGDSYPKQPQYNRIFYIGIPIVTDSRNWGVIGVIASPEFKEEKSLEKLLKYFAERVGICLDYEKATREGEIKDKYLQAYYLLSAVLNRWDDFSVSLPKIADVVRKFISFDFLLIARTDKDAKNIWRSVYSKYGRSLMEKGKSISLDDDLIGRILRSRKPEIFEYIPDIETNSGNGLPIPAGCCVGVPLVKGQRLLGAMALIRSDMGDYKPNDMNLLKFVAHPLSVYLDRLEIEERMARRTRQISYLAEALQECRNEADLKAMFKETAEMITIELPITSCRIMLFDRNRRALRTVGLYQARELDWSEDSFQPIPVDTARAHYLVSKENKPVIIDFEKPHHLLNERERRVLFYSGITCAVLIPIYSGDKHFGVVSLGEMRNLKRVAISREELDFVQAICLRIGLSLQMYTDKRKLESYKGLDLQNITESNRVNRLANWDKYQNQIMNALSSIKGSCELITDTDMEEVNQSLGKYLEVIERSSDRIRDITKDYQRESKIPRGRNTVREEAYKIES
ncbi:MAG: GAF domain-containing protein [candidate division Zixibacteria bacterium]|nr:GAF domain-containing protein [candidate division Zixibacteria bacterium]